MFCPSVGFQIRNSYYPEIHGGSEAASRPVKQKGSDEVHVLKLHGSLPASVGAVASGIVLERSSYDSMLFAESSYRDVLERIFQDSVVLSVGVSWTDVPLRDAAAQAKRRMPVARRMHFTVRQHRPSDVHDWWEERALTSSYGLRPLYYRKHEEVPDLVGSIARSADARTPRPGASFSELAAWLDSAGDFESQQQSAWFADHWAAVAASIEALRTTPQLAANDWLDARIERHLRHFIWFWLDPRERAARRKSVWAALAEAWHLVPEADQGLWQADQIIKALEHDPGADETDRALFDFAVGAYEIYGAEIYGPQPTAVADAWARRLDSLQSSRAGTRAARRVDLARRVFVHRDSPSNVLIGDAQAARWESMEAKVALDLAQSALMVMRRAQPQDLRLRDLPNTSRDRLWRTCDWVRELARVSGSNRREIGAIVLASFVAPATQAESDLVAAYRLVRELHPGQAEPTAAWSIIIGLIAVFVDQAGELTFDQLVELLVPWLRNKCGVIPVNESLVQVVRNNYGPHWGQFHRKAADLAPHVAQALMAIPPAAARTDNL
jgi:SIR2-like domain